MISLLLYYLIALLIISVAGGVCLFVIQNEKINRVIFIFMILWTLLMTFMAFTAQPENAIYLRALAILGGALGIISFPVRFMYRQKCMANVMVCIAALICLFLLI